MGEIKIFICIESMYTDGIFGPINHIESPSGEKLVSLFLSANWQIVLSNANLILKSIDTK